MENGGGVELLSLMQNQPFKGLRPGAASYLFICRQRRVMGQIQTSLYVIQYNVQMHDQMCWKCQWKIL